MFFINGERLIIKGDNLYPDYLRYNEISRGITTSKVGKVLFGDFYRKSEHPIYAHEVDIEFSLWRLVDKNANAAERGVDPFNNFTSTMPNGYRISYALVPRMNTDIFDIHPCEYTKEKSATFEDVNDPRVVLIARSYKGIVAEIAKDFIIKLEDSFSNQYRYTRDRGPFAPLNFRNSLTEESLRTLDPNAILE